VVPGFAWVGPAGYALLKFRDTDEVTPLAIVRGYSSVPKRLSLWELFVRGADSARLDCSESSMNDSAIVHSMNFVRRKSFGPRSLPSPHHSLRSQPFSSALLINSSIFSEEGGFSMSNSGAFGKPVAAMRRLASARS
jgi:hypothetical protein